MTDYTNLLKLKGTDLIDIIKSMIPQASENWYRRPQLFTVTKDTVTIPAGTEVSIDGKGYISDTDTTLDLSTAGSDLSGKDVYIYAVSTTDTSPSFVLSVNSTVPDGYTADNSRKIGGFHCLCTDVGTIDGHSLSDYTAGSILPLSCWDLRHRPQSNPEGMVYIDGLKLWVDIYLTSWSGSNLESVYSAIASSGESSPAFNRCKFQEYAGLCGKRLIAYDEFIVAAKGSNEGTNISGSTNPNTTGGHVDTNNRRMISNYGIEDLCGAIWQCGRDIFENYPDSYWGDESLLYLRGYTLQNAPVYNSNVDDQKYGSTYGLLRGIRLGGHWESGEACGSRCCHCYDFLSSAWGSFACRLVSEPRVVNI